MGVAITEKELIRRVGETGRYDWIDLEQVDILGANQKFEYTCKKCNSKQTGTVKSLVRSNIICKACKFINDSKKKWGDYYDYSDLVYNGMRKDTTIICPKHGKKTMQAYYHQDAGCDECSVERFSNYHETNRVENFNNFLLEAKEKHGDRFDYSNVDYTNIDNEIELRCKEHNRIFNQTPKQHLKYEHCCPVCRSSKTSNNKEHYLPIWNKYHNHKYNYSLVESECKSSSVVTIICPVHGNFKQNANTHTKHGCPKCAIESGRLSTEEILNRIKLNQRSEYDYNLVDFENIESTKDCIEVFCKKHGEFKQLVGSHIRGDGYPKCKTSLVELEVYDHVKGFIDCSVVTNTKKVIHPLELDLYIPEKNLAIEFNGIYWHGELKGKDHTYHLNKTEMCNDKNISLIHIFENEWAVKKPIVKSILNSRLGIYANRIYARNTHVDEINRDLYMNFCKENHIQSGINSKIRIGLFHEEDLVSVMSFSKPRYNDKYQHEMIRFCSKVNTTIIGGAEKLFKFFTKKYKPESVITYSDRRYFDGKVYEKLGFKFSGYSRPNYFYFKVSGGLILESRSKFQKHKLPDVLEKFDPSLTEYENMLNNGYDRIWDCGNSVFTYNK